MHPHYRGVAFLLSLGTLPIACGKDPGDDDSSTGNAPTTNLPDTSTGEGTTADTPTSGGQSGTSTSGSTSTSTSTSTGPDDTGPQLTTFLTNNPSTGEESDESGFPPPPPPEARVCISYLEHLEMCNPGSPYNAFYAYYCDVYLQYGARLDGPDCVAALETAFACLSMVECNVMDPFEECATQLEAALTACPNTFEDPIDTDGTTTEPAPDTDSSSTG